MTTVRTTTPDARRADPQPSAASLVPTSRRPEGRFAHEDRRQTPITRMTAFEHGGVLLVFEARGLVEKHAAYPRRVANEYHMDEGLVKGGQFHLRNGVRPEPFAKFDIQAKCLGDNREVVETCRNWRENVQCESVRLEASTYRLGRSLTVDPSSERFIVPETV